MRAGRRCGGAGASLPSLPSLPSLTRRFRVADLCCIWTCTFECLLPGGVSAVPRQRRAPRIRLVHVRRPENPGRSPGPRDPDAVARGSSRRTGEEPAALLHPRVAAGPRGNVGHAEAHLECPELASECAPIRTSRPFRPECRRGGRARQRGRPSSTSGRSAAGAVAAVPRSRGATRAEVGGEDGERLTPREPIVPHSGAATHRVGAGAHVCHVRPRVYLHEIGPRVIHFPPTEREPAHTTGSETQAALPQATGARKNPRCASPVSATHSSQLSANAMMGPALL